MIIGFTGHKGILGKSILNSLKKSKKSGYKVSLYKNNILDFKKLKKWVSKVDIIIHLAAVTAINKVNTNKNYAKKVNYSATKVLVKLLSSSDYNKKLIFISSSHVYSSSQNKLSENSLTKPISYYGRLKLLSENEIIKNLTNYTIIRLFSYYSKEQSRDFLIPALIDKIKYSKDSKLKIRNFNHVRDISSIDYVTVQILRLIFSNYKGTINCGSGQGITIKKLAEKIALVKFKKKITLDMRFKTKKITKIVSNNAKLLKITGIKKEDDLFKII